MSVLVNMRTESKVEFIKVANELAMESIDLVSVSAYWLISPYRTTNSNWVCVNTSGMPNVQRVYTTAGLVPIFKV